MGIARTYSLAIIGLGALTLSAQTAIAESWERAAPTSLSQLQQEAASPLALDTGGRHRAVTPLADGSRLVAGRKLDAGSDCGVRSNAFLAHRGIEDQELWQLSGKELFAAATEFVPGHVLASTVEAVTVDAVSGRAYAVVETLLGWRGGACAHGVDTALGTLVVSLDRHGLPEASAYLGTRPAGPPPAAFACSSLCAPERFPSYAGRSVEISPEGELLVAGGRRGTRPEDAVRGETLFTETFSLALERIVEKPASPPRIAPRNPVSCGVHGNVIRIDPLVETEIEDGPLAIQQRDDCMTTFRPMPGGNPSGVGPGHGFQIELKPPSGPIPYPPKLDIQFYIDFPTPSVVNLHLQDATTLEWVEVATHLMTGPGGILDAEVKVDNAPRWIGTSVKARIEIALWAEEISMPCQDGDMDYIDDDYGV